MKKFLFAISFLAAAACAPKALEVFDPSDAVVFSDMTVDKMAHCSIFKVIGDEVFFAYYHDTTQTLEHPKMPTIMPVLARSPWPVTGEDIEYTDVVRCGESYGSFTQDPNRAPYDPNLLQVGTKLRFYFNGCMGGKVVYTARTYDLESHEFEPEAVPCRICFEGDTLEMTSPNLFSIMERLGYATKDVNDVVISHRFIKYNGSWYNVVANGFTTASKPLVIKTDDGLLFDFVFACAEVPGGTCEAAFEFKGSDMYLITRNIFEDWHENATYLSKFSMKDGSCLSAPVKLTGQTAKSALINRKGNIYAFYNALPDIEKDGKAVGRSRLRMARIGKDCELLDSADVIGNYGIHYPYTDLVDGEVWMSFSEDRREISPLGYTRSNLSLIRLPL
ncbi:MAG: hypothetical protein MJY56_00345 [Bacteroidales bacterium]|nr:hypothetical protein [Bacteroidales bacterium]